MSNSRQSAGDKAKRSKRAVRYGAQDEEGYGGDGERRMHVVVLLLSLVLDGCEVNEAL